MSCASNKIFAFQSRVCECNHDDRGWSTRAACSLCHQREVASGPYISPRYIDTTELTALLTIHSNALRAYPHVHMHVFYLNVCVDYRLSHRLRVPS